MSAVTRQRSLLEDGPDVESPDTLGARSDPGPSPSPDYPDSPPAYDSPPRYEEAVLAQR